MFSNSLKFKYRNTMNLKFKAMLYKHVLEIIQLSSRPLPKNKYHNKVNHTNSLVSQCM